MNLLGAAVVGGVYTLIILFGGFAMGYLIGRGKLEEKAREVIERIKREKPKAPPTESGPVKLMGPEEYRTEEQAPLKDKVGQILEAPYRKRD